MTFSDVFTPIAINLIKGVVIVYDIITLPFYAAVQRPWAVLRKAKEVRGIQVNPRDPYSSWIKAQSRPLCLADKCQTVDELLRQSIAAYGPKNCFGVRKVLSEEDEVGPNGKTMKKKVLASKYQWFTFNEIDKRVDDVMRGFLTVGVKPGDNVMIFAETRAEWMISAQALLRLGATVATLYATLGEEGVIHGINEVEATHIVTDSDLLPKLRKHVARLPKVRFVINIELGDKQAKLEGNNNGINIISFDELEEKGRNAPESLKGKAPTPDEVAVICYTSGSTGTPKGVEMTHRNFATSVGCFYSVLSDYKVTDRDIYIAYLPLAHCLEFLAELLFLSLGVAVGYSHPLTLTSSSLGLKKGCPGDADIMQPTILGAVPIVLDRIKKAISQKVGERGKFSKALFEAAVEYKSFWATYGFDTPIANDLMFGKLRAILGSRVKLLFCGGAPLSQDTQVFIKTCLNLKLLQGYASTETTGVCCCVDLHDLSLGKTGGPLSGAQVKLIDWEEGNYRATDKPNPKGEIVVGGDFVCKGYLKNKEATDEAICVDEKGVRWFLTGDIGEIHPNGTFKIIDRKKDLVKLQMGEYVSLGKVEAELKNCEYVENICAYADPFHNYIIALVVPNPAALQKLAQDMALDPELTIDQLCNNPQVNGNVLKAIIDYGKQADLHKSEIPAKIKLCIEAWTPDSGLVTAVLKIRRKQIKDFYADFVQAMYR